jgi:hypothetical protein
MGLDYSIDLFIPADKVETLLLATSAVALRPAKKMVQDRQRGRAQIVPSGGVIPPLEQSDEYEKPLLIHLPSGRTAIVPFTSNFKTDPVTLPIGGHGLELDAVLVLPVDEAVREFQAKMGFPIYEYEEDDGRLYVGMGMIYLAIFLGGQYALFSYKAATTDMSLLFRKSRAIQGLFLDLLAEADGVAGLIDCEADRFPLLSDPERSVQVDGMDLETCEDIFAFDVDEFVESVLSQLK